MVAPANLAREFYSTFSIDVLTCGTSNYSNAVAIFIDYNQNGLFTDTGEKVYVSAASTSGAHNETGNITIPFDAVFGNTIMRVIDKETNDPSSILPCGTYGYGETEDYMINIIDMGPGVIIVTLSDSGQIINLPNNYILETHLPGNPFDRTWLVCNHYRYNCDQTKWQLGIRSNSTDLTVDNRVSLVNRFQGFQGTSSLEMKYERPWEAGNRSVDNFPITVVSNGNILAAILQY
ncbi:MAG: hypothetical protein IPH45_19135 [Bacteroidales bacterium]|nr:hypothetical protein [Bacteroidales bacterium]